MKQSPNCKDTSSQQVSKYLSVWGGLTDLCSVLFEEARGIHAVCDGAADDWEPGEDDRRLVGVLEEDLLRDVDDDRQGDKGRHHNANLRSSAHVGEALGHRARYVLEDTHEERCSHSRKRECK